MPIVNPAHQFLNYPRSQVGSYALDLANLADNDIPLPLTFCVPIDALHAIAEHNQLEAKFAKIRTNLKAASQEELNQAVIKLQKLIKQQAYPKQVSSKLLQLYYDKLDKDFIRLTASPVDGKKIDFKREDNIRGEANMMDSILTLWSRNIDPTDISDNNLFPVAIVIQAQTQPYSSGLAYSLNVDNGDKSKISIFSVFGVYHTPQSEAERDIFIVDQRNWQIATQLKSNQKTLLIRQPDTLIVKKEPAIFNQLSLSPSQAVKLARLVKKIKLQRTDQIKLHWELVNGQLLITKIKPYYHSYENLIDKDKYQTILIGDGITSGFINGRCQIVTNKKELATIKPGMIAVVPELTKDYRALVQVCQAIICETRINNNELLNQIRHYNLPTIVNVKGALKRLKPNQLITLDASAGRIYQVKSAHTLNQELNKSTKTQVLLAVNNFDEVTEKLTLLSNGIGLLRSEHLFIKTGLHPKTILNTQAKAFQEQVVQNTVNFFHRFINLKQQEPVIIYRCNNLDTNQLAKLDGGDIYESQEKNPFLGFRGGLRYLNQSDWFKYELQLIAKINKKLDQPVNLILPFVRNSFELQQLYLLIEAEVNTPIQQPPLWLQVTTPENLFNIKDYLTIPLTGMSINIKTIHALLHGVDPGFEDVYNQYTLNYQLLIPALKQLVSIVTEHNSAIKINFILSDFSPELLELAVDLQINGIVVSPKLAQQTKQFIMDLESSSDSSLKHVKH